jgi:hypothetical protein
MSAGYNEILKFIGNIFNANGKRLENEQFLQMWVREIQSTQADIADLYNAEIYIIRNDIPLKVNEIRKAIEFTKPQKQLPYTPKVKCPYCDGRGVVFGVKFDEKGRWGKGADYALNCVCGNSHHLAMATMDENDQNNKTMCKDGYFLIFPSVTEKFSYLDKVNANGGYDFKGIVKSRILGK